MYGTAQRVPIDETHPLQAQSPYSASKIAADKLAESYHLSFGLPVVTLRPFNTFGPRQSARAVIPTIISQLAAGSAAVRLGALDPTRDLTFVADTAQAFLRGRRRAARARWSASVLNAGTGGEISIGELAPTIARPDGPRARAVDRGRPSGCGRQASEVMRLVADSTRLREADRLGTARTLAKGWSRPIGWFSVRGARPATRHRVYNL